MLYRKRKRTYNKSTHLWPLSSTIHEFGSWKGKEKQGMTSEWEREDSPPSSAADLSARKKVSDCLFAGFMWWLTFEWWNSKKVVFVLTTPIKYQHICVVAGVILCGNFCLILFLVVQLYHYFCLIFVGGIMSVYCGRFLFFDLIMRIVFILDFLLVTFGVCLRIIHE